MVVRRWGDTFDVRMRSKAEPTGFADGSGVGSERKESGMSSNFCFEQLEEQSCHLLSCLVKCSRQPMK